METITYEYEDSLYVNLTNRCDCNCVFCLRHNGHKGSIYADDLWLEHEPSREEVLADFGTRDLTKYREIVFCGFGEPMFRTDDLLFLAGELKRIYPSCPPIRVNTNGHANLICGRDVTPELAGKIDVVSVSLNGANAADYCAVTHPKDGEKAFDAMLDFTKKAAKHVPSVVMTIVDKDDKTTDYVAVCRKIAQSLGAELRVREYIPN
ncbi:MAG: TatD family nuclease-associated radical SAM protein [Oscillospiraceae bacterium]